MRLLFDSFEALLLQVCHTRDFPLDASGHGYCNYFFGEHKDCTEILLWAKITLFLFHFPERS
jgi:hypothetical protein